MPAKGHRHSEEARRRIAEGVRRGTRKWKGAVKLLPKHIADYSQNGAVHQALRPSLRAAVHEVGSYAESLGGREALAEGELLMLQTLVRAKTVLNCLYERFVTTGDPSALEGSSPWLLAEARALQALGLKRRAREVPTLGEYIEAKAKATSPETPGVATAKGDESSVTPNGAAAEIDITPEVESREPATVDALGAPGSRDGDAAEPEGGDHGDRAPAGELDAEGLDHA